MMGEPRRWTPWLLDAQLARVAHMMPVTDLSDHLRAREATQAFKAFVGQVAADDRVDVREHLVSRPDDAQPLRLRLYRPKQSDRRTLPCLVYAHGGGFVLGDLEMEHTRCQSMAAEVGCLVVAVDFRLAPEHPYPAALNDVYLALQWVCQQADELQVRRERIAVGGCSTGATLAAAVALMARDRKGPAVCFQFLLYPALDDRLHTHSMQAYRDIPGGDRRGAALMWGHYLTGWQGEVPYLAAPARAQDLAGLPPAYLMVNDIDVCRDEELDYGFRLLRAGVPTELHCYSGTFHAFEIMVRSADISLRALEQQKAVLKRALHGRDQTDVRGTGHGEP
ncbi:alpha/beta hydrolase [Rubrivivax sp. RP6-9]|uniref:alpha/beta hydrolase n=1 Tax=Rubrivivax sp. RP6-9 TaxID=3415750 RepID=UPI003CC69C40